MIYDGSDKRVPEDVGRFAIVVARFNPTITGRLLEGAVETLKKHGVSDDQIDVVHVPGAFEIPHIANRLARVRDKLVEDVPVTVLTSGCSEAVWQGKRSRKRSRYAAIICLGAVIRGETSHDQHINRAISLAFSEISLRTGVPCLFGVLTCNTLDQAIARSGGLAGEITTGATGKETIATRVGHKGIETAEAALEMVALLHKLPR
ncbi:MAG: 6,7-dimethyl-8-ribityllumazine synthase [Thermoguttaceae bacterium]|nr:6,7-dimethyl-8-ribityllumazine synthase [Thermoguttaceae bacterium]